MMMLQVLSRLIPREVGGPRFFSQTETQDLQSSRSLQQRRSRNLTRRSRWGKLDTRLHRVRAGKRRGMQQHMS